MEILDKMSTKIEAMAMALIERRAQTTNDDDIIDAPLDGVLLMMENISDTIADMSQEGDCDKYVIRFREGGFVSTYSDAMDEPNFKIEKDFRYYG